MSPLARFALVATFALAAAAPARAAGCSDMWEWVNTACRKVVDTYDQGGNELLLSGWSWHIPATWTPERRAEENEKAWGAGWARTVEKGNDTDTVYFLVFSDSHKKPEFNLGYAWNRFWGGDRRGPQVGLGYTAFVMQRQDIAKGIPFPVILPLFSARWDKVTLHSTFIPTLNGGINHGSVFYVFGKVSLY
jgi:lipid IVA palmitoyltransferase